MQQQSIPTETGLIFSSPLGINHPFTITVNAVETVYEITVKAADTGKTYNYTLDPAKHHSYLDLYEKLHAHFGLRLPRNRKTVAQPSFKANYTTVLSENLDIGMLYGYGDPAIIRADKNGKPYYYLVCTSNDAPDSFPIIRSANLKDWDFAGYIFPQGQKPAWAADGEMVSDYWAPEMHKVGNEFRVYFVARDKQTHELCIGMATSENPEGPFKAEPEPLLIGNVIDPHLFIQDNNTSYLFWKKDNNDIWPGALISLLYNNTGLIHKLFSAEKDVLTASFVVTLWPWLQTLQPMERFLFTQVFIESVTSKFKKVYELLISLATDSHSEAILSVTEFMKTPMFACQLTNDGKSFIAEATKVLENDLNWEAHLVEGMWVTRHQDKYYLFYAGNDFSTDEYGIGLAIADAPLGPYHKVQEPFLQSTAEWLAPGHPSVTTGLDGDSVMFLHAYSPGKAGYKQFRALLSVKLNFKSGKVYPQ